MTSGNYTTIARPYAAAAFEYARAEKALPAWETMLHSAANITLNADVARMLASPATTVKQAMDLYTDLLGKQLDTHKKNFIHLLADNDRLTVLPDIAELFKTAREQQDKVIAVQVTSAIPLTDAYRAKLQKALTKRLEREVELECEVDPTMLGGALIRAGDIVIDGSVRGKLTRLNEFI
jgi:F-type H+-transporting ATPase subunit delta